MANLVTSLLAKPWVAHLIRANTRFTNRLGNAFAGSITYFSVLSLVPIALIVFSVVSVVLAGRAGLVESFLVEQLGVETGQQLMEVLRASSEQAGLTGVIGLLVAVYTGSAWMAQLKSAVRAQWRPSFDDPERKANLVVETLGNVGLLLVMLVLVALTFSLAGVATQVSDQVIAWAGLGSVPGIGVLTRLVPVLASLLIGFALFSFLFRVLPQDRLHGGPVLKGCAAGAVGLALLQYGSTLLVGVFGNNAAIAVFGPVILLMLFFNLFARLTLFLAAWIPTAQHRAVPGEPSPADAPLEADPEIELEPVVAATPESPRGQSPYAAQQTWARREGVRVGPEVLAVTHPDPEVAVPQTVAVRGARVASAVGWLLGAASGVGLGALATSLLRRRR